MKYSLTGNLFSLYLHHQNGKAVQSYYILVITSNAKVAQLVEHDLAKVGVASSNLVFRSNPFPYQEGIEV